MSKVEQRLAAQGISIPPAVAPVASYVPWVRVGDLVFISGQIPMEDGKVCFVGLLGEELDLAKGQQAALLVARNLLAQIKSACEGDLDRVVRIVRLGGFVASTPNFIEHPKVINAASELMVMAFGEAGRHARAAVGVSSLPFGVAVEIDAIVQVSS